MEKKLPPQESMENVINELRQKTELLDTLAELDLTGRALLALRKGKTLVIPEKALGQLTELGRMSLAINHRDVFELGAMSVGRKIGKVEVADDVILPSKVLAVIDASRIDIATYGIEKPFEVLQAAVSGEKEDIELLKKNEGWFKSSIFVNHDIPFDDVLNGRFDMIVHPNTLFVTDNYFKKVRNAGAAVFEVHIHDSDDYAAKLYTAEDIEHTFGALQHMGWGGILNVPKLAGHATPADFSAVKDSLVFFQSSIEDIKPLKGARDYIEARDIGDGKGGASFDDLFKVLTHPFERNFSKTHRAKLITYAELLNEAC